MKTSEFGFRPAIQNLPASREQFTRAGRLGRSFGPIFLIMLIALATAGCAEYVKTQPSPSSLQIKPTSLPNVTAQTIYQASLAATGGTTPYTWSIDSGQLSS